MACFDAGQDGTKPQPLRVPVEGTMFPSSRQKKKRQPGLAQRPEDLGPLKLSKTGVLGDPYKDLEKMQSVF